MYMVLLVLDDPEQLEQILNAWENAGARGATILESSGMYQHQEKQGYVPMRYIIPTEGLSEERGSLTLFSVVKNQDAAETLLRITEGITGDLNQPNSGIFAAWPLVLVKGIAPREEG